jgi:N-acetylglucosamine kinase-like BadF-type ATPase
LKWFDVAVWIIEAILDGLVSDVRVTHSARTSAPSLARAPGVAAKQSVRPASASRTGIGMRAERQRIGMIGANKIERLYQLDPRSVNALAPRSRRAALLGPVPPCRPETRPLTDRVAIPMLRVAMYVLGIDAGGTKTICLLADEQGRILSEARGGGANLKTAGELGVEKVLHTVMEEALGDRQVVPSVVCLGMAGADRAADAHTVRAIMRRIGYKAKTLVVNDALIALVAGAGDAPGVAVLAGTGSIVYGRNSDNQAARAGGWGHILGDEGSGYWIGRKALVAVVREGDGRGPATLLTPRVFAHFGIASISDLVQLLYDRDAALPFVAALAPVVQGARDDGDDVASLILTRAADELILAATSVVGRLGMTLEGFPFVLAGGIFSGLPWLLAELERRLPGIAPRASVKRLRSDPAVGAVRLALAEARGEARIPAYVQSGGS